MTDEQPDGSDALTAALVGKFFVIQIRLEIEKRE